MRRTIYVMVSLLLLTSQSHAQETADSIRISSSQDSINSDSFNDTTEQVRSYPTGNTIGDPILVTSIPSSATHQTYTNTVNTNDYTNNYTGQSTKDVFYCFTLPKEMIVTLTHEYSSVANTYMTLLSNSMQVLAQNDDYYGEGHCSSPTMAYIRTVLPAGYYYVVSEGKTNDGYITTNMTFDAMPAGNTLDDPIIAGSYSASFNYQDTRDTRSYGNHTGHETGDVYYRFTISTDMAVTISHQGSSLSDTYLYLLNSSGSVIAYNDNYSGGGHCSDTCQAFISRQLSAGTYYVVSEGKTANGIITTNISGNTEAGYDYPVIPSTYSSEPGTAVGAMGGAFGVSPMGGATYSIPIAVPQGVGGLQPQLGIVYNSQAGNGLCGYGASLSGLSSITRGPKDIFHDGTAQGMTYMADDALYMDGVRLILKSGTAGQNGATYNPESDPFTEVIQHGSFASTTNIWFEVNNSDGMKYWYGYDTYQSNDYGSRLYYTVGTSQRIHSWYLCRAQQPTGNYMTYSYQQDNNCVYPYRIYYGSNVNQSGTLSNVVEFTYDSRADSILIRFDAQKGSMQKRLANITGKTNGNTFRSYDLNYSMDDGTAYKFSRLTGVTEKNAQNQALPASQLNWSYLPVIAYSNTTLTDPVFTHQVPFSGQYYSTGDINGDGFSDIISYGIKELFNNSAGYSGQIYAYFYPAQVIDGTLSFPTGYECTLDQIFSISDKKFCFLNTIQGSSSTLDFNGDGLNEFVVPYYFEYDYGNNILKNYKLLLCGFDQSTNSFNINQLLSSVNSKPLFSTGDLDNNGTSDVVVLETSHENGKYRCRIGRFDNSTATVNTEVLNLEISDEPKKMFLSDMNGNGLTDMMVIHVNGYCIYWNNGEDYSGGLFSDNNKTTDVTLTNAFLLTPGDFNGDGLIDLLRDETDASSCHFYFNNGNGSFKQQLACTLNVYNQGFTTHDDDKLACNVIDFDGDGKDDVVISKAVYNRRWDITGYYGEFDKTHTYWMRSSGTELIQVYHATSNKYNDALANKYITGDFDGDGRMELVNYGYDCVHGVNANSDPVWRIYKNSGLTAQSGKVTSITGDFGATTTITYSTLADQSVYTKGSNDTYPAPRYTIPLNVVKQTTQSNGAAGSMTTQYSYEGLKAHLRGRGLLGFSKTVATNTTTGVTAESGVTQWDTVHYIPKVSYSRTTIGSDVSQTTNTLSISDSYITDHKIYFAYPSQTVETDMDGFTTSIYRTYETGNGYILSDSTVYGTNMYRAVRYGQYTGTKVGGVYRPQTVVTLQRHPDDTSPYSVTTQYTYNSTTGTVSTKVDNYGTTAPLTTSYSYDSWGNLTSELSTFSGNTTPCTTYYSYDATHRFTVRIYTSPASSVRKYTYDTWGNVLTEQDSINTSINNTVTNTYDAWGNITCTQKAGDGEVTYTRGWGSDASQRWFVLEQGTGRPWVKTWYDNQGREVLMESIGPKNVSVSSTTSYSYNNHELTVSSTEVNGDLSLTSRKKYDVRGRVMNEIYPGGRRKTYGYLSNGSIRIVTVTEDGNTNRTTTYRYDAMGNLFKVEGPASSSIENTFSSNGGILQTTTNNATWTFQYDDRGNRTSITDPDAGTTTYVYDAFGRETSRADARGVVFSTNYDYLGRVSSVTASKSGNSETISYTYGNSSTGGTGQMRPISESLNGWTKTYTYDTYGHVTSETMGKTGVISRTKSYTYDSNGLLTASTQPGDKAFAYTYDAYGNLTGVNGAGGAVKWNLTGYTGRRTVSETVLDNNTSYPFVKTHLLDQYGYLDSICTVQDDCWYQEDDYNFSPVTGNLLSMKQNWMDYPQTFGYDNLDRLTSVSENNQEIMNMVYAANGNITSKTGVGSYTYNSSVKPHAVQSVSNTDGFVELEEQDITYNLWGKVSSIWCYDENDFYSYSVEYGPDLERVSTRLDKTYHIEYEKFQWGDYEEKTTDGVTTCFYFVNGADGLAGLHTVSSTQGGTETHTAAVMTDHLGSITTMADNLDWCYDAHYDVWGNREVQLPFYYSIERGYTGHEQPEGLRLIDMRGRMYDPVLGRFISPDAFVQAPTDPQNYNRYSYCLNNPLKYTDPTGDIFGAPFGFLSDLIDNTIRFFKGDELDWTQTILGLKIDLGFFILDGNKSKGAQAWELASRFLWQTPQIVLGDFLASAYNAFGGVNDVSYGYGMTALDVGLEDGRAVTLGYLTAGSDGYKADWHDHTFVHEYGHYIQSQQHGPVYLLTVGVPSLQSAILQTDNPDSPRHRNRWFEADASYKGAEYFDKYYGSGSEDYEENSEDFFDLNSFSTGKESLYTNPRTNVKNSRSHPISATFHWTDIIIYFPFIGLVPWFWYK